MGKRGPAIKGRVAEAWLGYPHKNVDIATIADDAGVEIEQARQATNTMAREGLMNIETVVRGTVYRYVPNDPQPDDGETWYKEIAHSRNGTVVLEDGEGTLWTATKI